MTNITNPTRVCKCGCAETAARTKTCSTCYMHFSHTGSSSDTFGTVHHTCSPECAGIKPGVVPEADDLNAFRNGGRGLTVGQLQAALAGVDPALEVTLRTTAYAEERGDTYFCGGIEFASVETACGESDEMFFAIDGLVKDVE